MKTTVDVQACTTQDPTTNRFNAGPTDTASQVFTFKHGVGQMFRIRSQVSIANSIASDGSNNVTLGPFWTTPSDNHVLMFLGFSIASPFTASGAITTLGVDLYVNANSNQFINHNSAGTFSAGTYSISNTNRFRFSMATDPGLLLLGPPTGGGTAGFLTDGVTFHAYDAPFLGNGLYVRLRGNAAWSILTGAFTVNAAGFVLG